MGPTLSLSAHRNCCSCLWCRMHVSQVTIISSLSPLLAVKWSDVSTYRPAWPWRGPTQCHPGLSRPRAVTLPGSTLSLTLLLKSVSQTGINLSDSIQTHFSFWKQNSPTAQISTPIQPNRSMKIFWWFSRTTTQKWWLTRKSSFQWFSSSFSSQFVQVCLL